MSGIVDGVNGVAKANGTSAPSDAEHPLNVSLERHIDIVDIVALNARSEIALGQWDDGCTALAWDVGCFSDSSGSAPQEVQSRLHKRILAQNWDWRTTVGRNLVLTSIKQEGKPDIWMVMEVRFRLCGGS